MIPKTEQELIEFLKKINFEKQLDQLAKKYKDKSIIIYGTGLFFKIVYENYNLNKLNITGISDKRFLENKEDNKLFGYNIIDPLKINEYKPDIVLICTYYDQFIEFFYEDFLFKKTGKFKYKLITKKPLNIKIQDTWDCLDLIE